MATHSSTLVLKIPWMEELGAGYSPSGHKESGATERLHFLSLMPLTDFPSGSDCKMSVYNARDLGSIPGLGRFPGEGNGNPLQYSCLENPMDRGAWWATVHGVSKSRTRLSDFTLTFRVSYGEGNGSPLQYSCLDNPMDGGAW